GKELLRAGPEPNFWRAPLANETDEWGFRRSNIKHRADWFGRMPSTEWYSTTLDNISSHLVDFKVINEDDGVAVYTVTVQTLNYGKASFINRLTYHINSEGEIKIRHTIIPEGDLPSWLPRVGIRMSVDRSMETIEWFGRGPQENYPDRKSGYKTGVYKSTVTDMYEPYLIPQDYGLRTDTRWLRITDNSGTGLEFRGNGLFNFNYYPFSTDNLTRALYTYQLHRSDYNTLNIDYATSGTGCTALSVFPQYQVIPQKFDFTIIITPVKDLTGNR
ncbi:MAG: beta-galactosidase small subunit, partial [Bacteroidales bacterium]